MSITVNEDPLDISAMVCIISNQSRVFNIKEMSWDNNDNIKSLIKIPFPDKYIYATIEMYGNNNERTVLSVEKMSVLPNIYLEVDKNTQYFIKITYSDQHDNEFINFTFYYFPEIKVEKESPVEKITFNIRKVDEPIENKSPKALKDYLRIQSMEALESSSSESESESSIESSDSEPEDKEDSSDSELETDNEDESKSKKND